MESQLDLTNYPIWYAPFTQTLGFKIAVIAAILILLAIFILIFLWFRKQKDLPYWDICKRQLIELNNISDPKIFYKKLTDILKFYLNKRFKLNLNNLTELEIVDFLSDSKIEYIHIDTLKKIFVVALQAKYNSEINNLDLKKDLNSVIDFISKTEPRENAK